MATRPSHTADSVRSDTSLPDHAVEEKHVSKTMMKHVDTVVHNLVEKLEHAGDVMAPIDDIEYVMDRIEALTVPECKAILEELLKSHEYDYNFSNTLRQKLAHLLKGPGEGQSTAEWELELKTETAVNKFYSPYPEVRAIQGWKSIDWSM